MYVLIFLSHNQLNITSPRNIYIIVQHFIIFYPGCYWLFFVFFSVIGHIFWKIFLKTLGNILTRNKMNTTLVKYSLKKRQLTNLQLLWKILQIWPGINASKIIFFTQ